MAIKLILILFLNIFITTVSADETVSQVIKNKTATCRNNSPFNCIKPVDLPGSKVKALELIINGTKSFQMITYDKLGNKIQLEDKFQFAVRGTRVPPTLNVDIVPIKKETKSPKK